MSVSLLQILGVLPLLIKAVELLFKGFPGQGAVKKEVVMSGVNAMVNAAGAFGVTTYGWAETASGLIDSYVAVQNAIGEFRHEGARIPEA